MKILTSIILIFLQFAMCLGKEEHKYKKSPNLKNGVYIPVESSYSFTVDKNNIAHPTLCSFGVLGIMLPETVLSVENPSFLEKSIYLDAQMLTLADVIKYLYKINKNQIYLLGKKINPNDPRWKSYKFRCGAAKYSYAFLLQIFISIYNELWAYKLKPEDEKNKSTITYVEFTKDEVYIKVAFYNLFKGEYKNNSEAIIQGAKEDVFVEGAKEDDFVDEIRITEDYSNRSFSFIINDLRKKLAPQGYKIILKTKNIDYVIKQLKCDKVHIVVLIHYLVDTANDKLGKKFDLKFQGKNIIISETSKK